MFMRIPNMLTPRRREHATPAGCRLVGVDTGLGSVLLCGGRLDLLSTLTPPIMPNHEPAQSATTDGLTISPALDLVAESAQIPQQHALVDLRVLRLCGMSVLIGVVAAFTA